MTEDAVRNLIRRRAARFANRKGSSGVTAWARHYGVRKGHLSEFMAGKRAPTSDTLAALGLEWRIVRKSCDSDGSPKGGDACGSVEDDSAAIAQNDPATPSNQKKG